jgi:hypothetical protein
VLFFCCQSCVSDAGIALGAADLAASSLPVLWRLLVLLVFVEVVVFHAEGGVLY